MPEPLIPARPAFASDGTPYADAYGDVYHAAGGGLAQARQVFLAGNGLPGRWSVKPRFTVLELGFGFGLAFLAAWQAWRAATRGSARLHFVSVEKHPFAAHDLAALHEPLGELAPLAAQLRDAWPLLVPGVHRLEFDGGRVVLTLALGDVAAVLPQLRLAADAFFLDGFAPAKNPEMWSPQVMRQLARLAAPEATAATWSAASAVRSALEQAGFEVEKRPGFERKREMLCARFRGQRREPQTPSERRAIVIGAGIAGAAVSERLCARGWSVALLERRPRPLPPGRHAGIFHPVATPDDSLFARLTRAGFLAARARWRALENAGAQLVRDDCGVLQLARDAREEAAQATAIAAHGYPPEYAQLVTRAQASAHAGLALPCGGLWFPSSGWIRPLSLVAAQLVAAGSRLEARFGCEVTRVERAGGQWTVHGATDEPLAAAPVLVLANAADAAQLFASRHLRMRRVRGQITFLPEARFAAPHVVVLRGGFVLPAHHGESIAGASYDLDDDDAAPRASSHEANLERRARILPGAPGDAASGALDGLVGFRAVTPDRLPAIGALPDEAAALSANARLEGLARAPGLYGAFGFGSRGLLWAALGAELLASRLEGEPLPLEARLADALDPARFALRAARRRAA